MSQPHHLDGWVQAELFLGGKPASAVRNDCAFCHRERTALDDNHDSTCAYWAYFPNGNT